MALEKLLHSARFVDEQIHRQYEKLGSRLDALGPRARYGGAALGTLACMFLYKNYSFLELPINVLTGFDAAVNFYACIGRLKEQEDTSESRVKATPPVIEEALALNKIARTPLFLAGVGLAGAGLYGIVKGENTFEESYVALQNGAGLLGISTSMFLKDKEPRLLKKDPLWKRAYDWTREKITSLEPSPSPIPIPVQRY